MAAPLAKGEARAGDDDGESGERCLGQAERRARGAAAGVQALIGAPFDAGLSRGERARLPAGSW